MVLNEVGRVSLVQDGVVLFIAERDYGWGHTRYQVHGELPFIYRKEGLRIRFSGIRLPMSENARYAALPLRWTSIQKE